MKTKIFLTALLVGSVLAGHFAHAQAPVFTWAVRAGGTGWEDNASDIAVDAAGDLLVVGRFEGVADFGDVTVTSMCERGDAYAAKYDPQGNLVWIRHFGGSAPGDNNRNFGFGIATDLTNNVIITGTYGGSVSSDGINLPVGGGPSDLFLVKYAANGDLVWARAVIGNEMLYGNAVATDTLGNIFVTGWFAHHNFGGWAAFDSITLTAASRDMFVAKFDPDGNVVWAKQAGTSQTGGENDDMGHDIAVDPAGNCIVTGRFGGTATFGTTTLTSAGKPDMFLAKYDQDGNVLWARRVGGGPEYDLSWKIVLDADGNIFATGSFTGTVDFGGSVLSSEGDSDVFVAKFDPSGDLLWVRTGGGPGSDSGYGIARDVSGNIFVTGSFQGSSNFSGVFLTSMGDSDIFVAQYNNNGDLLWIKQAPGTGNRETALGITLDSLGKGYIAGYFDATVYFDGITLISGGGESDIFIAKFGTAAQEQITNTGPANLWIGLKNSDDQGTQFDLKTELYINDVLISEGETLCITGVTRNPSYATMATVPFGPVSNGSYETGDTLSLKVLTRIGSNPDGSKCSGPGGSHNNARGLRLYYDSPIRASGFGAEISQDPMKDFFLHSTGTNYFLNDASPTGAVKYKDSSGVNFNNGNPWKEIGTWDMTLP